MNRWEKYFIIGKSMGTYVIVDHQTGVVVDYYSEYQDAIARATYLYEHSEKVIEDLLLGAEDE